MMNNHRHRVALTAAMAMAYLITIETIPGKVLSFSPRYSAPRSISFISPSIESASYRYSHQHEIPRCSLQTLHARRGAMARRKKHTNEDESKLDTIYSLPPLYDLAFGYRNYEDEVDFLIDIHKKYSKHDAPKPLQFIELAAGPARHSLAALSQYPSEEVGLVVALDRSQDMMKYGSENADFDLGTGGGRRDDFAYICGDMRNIEEAIGNHNHVPNDTKFDAVWLLLGSMQHLLKNDDIITCFQSIHSVLHPGGTVVIELPHPRETFSMGECTKNGWTVPLVDDVDDDGNEKEYGELSIIWGDEDDEFDPVAQVRRFTVSMELSIKNPNDIPDDMDTSPLFRQMSEDGKTTLREIVPMRLFTLQEVDALARCAGLELVAKYGALTEDVGIEDEEEAYRMVCILKKSDE